MTSATCSPQTRGADLLWRVSEVLELPVRGWLPDGSYRSEVLPAYVRNNLRGRPTDATSSARRHQIPVRVVEYMVTNRNQTTETVHLISTIADHERAPAAALAALYQQRWEFELTLDELETHQMPHSRVLRSRTPDLVRQEIWAMLLVHWAVRGFIREAADDLELDPDRLSFIRGIRIIRRQVLNQAGFSPSSAPAGRPGNP